MRTPEPNTQSPHASPSGRVAVWSVFIAFLRLGMTSFGGPIAHLGYFRDEFVGRRRWLSDQDYADLVALCQFLPGPASSQVGMALGMMRAGHAGALAAWAGFTLPSAAALVALAVGLTEHGHVLAPGVVHGLKVVAVAVVAHAVWGMARSLCPDGLRAGLMVMATAAVLWQPSAAMYVTIIVLAGGVGAWLIRRPATMPAPTAVPASTTNGARTGAACLALFFVLLAVLPMLAAWLPGHTVAMVDAFYRVGSLVFGGGHVVLPLLQAEVVPPGWVDADTFVAGYAAAQAVPGPLFTFAAFLGATMTQPPTGWSGGLLALLAIFAPSFLLVAGVLPFWERLRRQARLQAALAGTNAAVVGLLLAALYDPLWTSAVGGPRDFCFALLALVALAVWRWPAWLVVAAGAITGGLLGA